jgi:hypothetical protein
MQTNEEIRQKIREGHRYKTGTRGFFAKAATPCFRTCLSTAFIFFFFLDILALKIDRAQAVPDPEPKLLDSNLLSLHSSPALLPHLHLRDTRPLLPGISGHQNKYS